MRFEGRGAAHGGQRSGGWRREGEAALRPTADAPRQAKQRPTGRRRMQRTDSVGSRRFFSVV